MQGFRAVSKLCRQAGRRRQVNCSPALCDSWVILNRRALWVVQEVATHCLDAAVSKTSDVWSSYGRLPSDWRRP